MEQIALHEAKIHLSELIAKVNQGSEYIITRRGIPVARLIPAEEPSREAAKEAIKAAKELRKNLSLGGLKIKDLMNEGRKY